MFRSRASSFRLSKHPSFVYPVALILADGSPTAFVVCDAQATRNNDEAMPSAIRQKLFTVTSNDRVCDYRPMILMDLKERGVVRYVGLGIGQPFSLRKAASLVRAAAHPTSANYFREGTCSELMEVVRLSEKHKESVKKRERKSP